MNDVSRRWLRRIIVVAIVLLTAALLGVFTPERRDARLTFSLRPGSSMLQVTLPEKCKVTRLQRLSGPETPRGTLKITAGNGWSAALPLASASGEDWRKLERSLLQLPPGCRWTLQGVDLPPGQEEVMIEITLNGPAETMRSEWRSWSRLLPAENSLEKTPEDSAIGD